MDVPAATAALTDFEQRLDPVRPERAGAHVVAYGEISAGLTIETPALQGLMVKRMTGFADRRAVTAYVDLVREYLTRLAELGIAVVPTEIVPVEVPKRRPGVYLLQPLLPADRLGHRLLHDVDDARLAELVRTVLDQTLTLFAANAASPSDEISVDEQLSNWWFGPDSPDPLLLDVGTPFVRRQGQHAFDQENLLAAVPPGIRSYYRHKGSAATYMDDYFQPRLVAVDLVANFHKEGAPGRIPLGLAVVNEWLRGAAGDLQRALGAPVVTPVTEDEVADYYRQDAATLELFLRARRLDRAVRRLLRRRYDFILPGKVRR